jgi:hypothetical protein
MSLDTQMRSSFFWPGDMGGPDGPHTGPMPSAGPPSAGPRDAGFPAGRGGGAVAYEADAYVAPDPLGVYTEPTPTGPFVDPDTGEFTGPGAGPHTGPLAVGTTAGAFSVLDSQVRLHDADHATIAARRDQVENVLRSLFRPHSSLPLVGVATIGSAGRDTMIRPLDEVDVFAVFSAATGAWKRFRFDSTGLLTAIREAVGGDQVEVIGSRGKALRLVYGAAPDVHLIPAFDHPRAGYVMADGVGGWLPTRPERHASWMAGFGAAVASTVRLLKFWNRVYGSHLRSFHLEALTGCVVGARGLDTRQALLQVFTAGERGLEAYDPAGVGGDLSCYLTEPDAAALTEAFAFARTHAAQAVAAEAVADHEEAISMWRLVFGPTLPAFG